MKQTIISILYSCFKIFIISIPVIMTIFIFNGIDEKITILTKLNLIYGLLFSFVINLIFIYIFEFKKNDDDLILYYVKRFISILLILILISLIIVYGFNLLDLKDGNIVEYKFAHFISSLYFKLGIFIIFLSEIIYNYNNSNAVLEISSLTKIKNRVNESDIKKIYKSERSKLNNLLKK